jgi:hypothetical protein
MDEPMSKTLSFKTSSAERPVEPVSANQMRVRVRNNEISNEEKSTIILTKLLMNEEDRSFGNLVKQLETSGNIVVPVLGTVEPESKRMGRMLIRKNVSKGTDSFYLFDCPSGFGFYSIANTNCAKYKRCDNWSNHQAILTIYQCLPDTIFSFTKLKCVSKSEYQCEDSVDKFASLDE